KDLVEGVIPDSQELAGEVSASVRVQEIVEWGRERLPAGPAVEESEELIIVEGRADVINLLKHGFKNAIAMNGTSAPPSLLELCKRKDVTIFCDGDRGGDLIIKAMLEIAEVDWVTKAPDGMEVEEITKKEIHKALRSKINVEQARHEYSSPVNALKRRRMMSDVEPGTAPGPEGNVAALAPVRNPPDMRGQDQRARPMPAQSRPDGRNDRRMQPSPMQGAASVQAGPKRPVTLSPEERKKFGTMLESLVGTRGAYLLDQNQNILGKVPLSELASTLKSLSKGNVYAVLLDGPVEKETVESCELAGIKHIVGMDSKVNPRDTSVNIVVAEAL
ncbi:MAG TPA: toprim domain-containing protein, partial [Candidatus Nanoarchaeia archaeon]|nr:toprim domain-containing protein [Candidatus Nanoarchaeia archaeon]